jgi:RNA polymerase sigma-70 factor (ECF subfamily)
MMDREGRLRLQRDLTRLASGDREVFHAVFVALLPLLRSFASRALPDADVEDAAQETLVKVFLRATEFDTQRDALSWVLGIAAYEMKTARRRRQRRREQDAEPETILAGADPLPSPEQKAIAKDLDAAIESALLHLSASDAATLRAFAEGERPHDVAPATFRKRVERGLARLRARWRRTHDGR